MKLTEKNALLKQLENHNKSAPKALNDAELQELFKKTIIEWTRGFIAASGDKNHAQIINIDEVERDVKVKVVQGAELYSVFNELLQKYPYAQIRDSVVNNTKPNVLEKTLLILEVKYREYQEILLENIEDGIDFMPQEEVATFMDFVESKREDIELLKGIHAQLKNNKVAQNIERISNTKKYILTNFMPQDLEANYHEFFARAEDKQALVAKLKSISNAYSKRQLDAMTKEDIVEILSSFRQGVADAKRDKEDFDKYSELIKQALYNDDAFAFNALFIEIIEGVSPACLAKLKAHFTAEDPLFDSKFQAAQREWSKFK